MSWTPHVSHLFKIKNKDQSVKIDVSFENK